MKLLQCYIVKAVLIWKNFIVQTEKRFSSSLQNLSGENKLPPNLICVGITCGSYIHAQLKLMGRLHQFEKLSSRK